jgi:hypothetical protein
MLNSNLYILNKNKIKKQSPYIIYPIPNHYLQTLCWTLNLGIINNQNVKSYDIMIIYAWRVRDMLLGLQCYGSFKIFNFAHWKYQYRIIKIEQTKTE